MTGDDATWSSAVTGKAVTLRDVAARAGVSKALASMVLRGIAGPSAETAERVLTVADDLGYRANRTASLLALRRTRLVGVAADIRNSFHAELVEDVVAEADRLGYEIVLGPVTPTHSETKVVETLLDFRCEALILIGPELSDTALATLAATRPVVVVGRRIAAEHLDVVHTTDDTGTELVVDHLVALGHRRIAYLTGGDGTIATDRRDGYARAMRRHGLDAEIDVLDGDFTESAGSGAAARLLARATPPTAVATANDRSAVGLLDALRRAGVDVPGDISVAGYDDSSLARLTHIDLTSVNQRPREQAVKAVQAVVSRLDDARTDRALSVLQPDLVVRATTGPAPGV